MRFTRFDGRALYRALRADAEAALEEAAKSAPKAIVEALYNGRTTSGRPQQQNRPATLEQKRKQGLGSTPLIGKNQTLTKADLYQVIRRGGAWVVLLPPGYAQVMRWLHRYGYRLMEIGVIRKAFMVDVKKRVGATLAKRWTQR